MKRILLSILIVAAFYYPQLEGSEKIRPVRNPAAVQRRQEYHPIEHLLSAGRELTAGRRDFGKLLVLLIEFDDTELLEDNPQTTGNGKFVQDPEGYPISLGRPPHDHEFFRQQLEALRYYYRAASLYYHDGISSYGFDLDYDIYPLPGENDEFQAYTLPNELAYYSPVTTDNSLLISRFEEYFQHCFQIADQDDDIDFSQYEHFMFIHAGSDWQHDTFGDTPSDMPSFFIQIGDGKEAIVDNGTVIIDHACNVPETITQDIIVYDQDSEMPEIQGYGLINAVMAHEFGHSMGFVDLYNTSNFYPGVGYYDIMDSGGFGQIGITVPPGEENSGIYFLEGGLPSLPGAWSRIIAWEDDFRSRGILRDFNEFQFDQEIEIAPAEKLFNPYRSMPYFIRLPLNDNEYLLIENRQIDPDGDGGTYVHTSPDNRVVLYPTPINEDPSDTTATYEYDYLLPGWIRTDQSVVGGGLLIWHVNDDIIYNQGNYYNNTVNYDYYNRGVKIIEADNIEDIGNPYSYFWRGTEYDPYYKYKPVLIEYEQGVYFLEWDIPGTGTGNKATHNDSLAGNTAPPLLTSNGIPSFFSIYNISSYNINPDQERTMSFKIGAQQFTDTEMVCDFDSVQVIGEIGQTGFFGDTFWEIPVIADDQLYLYFDIQQGHLNWLELQPLDLEFAPQAPLTSADLNADGFDEYYCYHDNLLNIISNDNYNFVSNIRDYISPITDQPLIIPELETLVVPTLDFLFVNDDSLLISSAKCYFTGNDILASAEGKLTFIDPENLAVNREIDIPGWTPVYAPVTYQDTNPDYNAVFIQNESGDIYRIKGEKRERIFQLSSFTSHLPTQLGLAEINQDGFPYLVFGAGSRSFALSLDGSLAAGYPGQLDGFSFKPYEHLHILEIDQEMILLFREATEGYLALDRDNNLRMEYSFSWINEHKLSQFYWDEYQERFYFVFSDPEDKVYASYRDGITENPLIWNGANKGHTIFNGNISYQPDPGVSFRAYAYPNPASRGEVRIRVLNAYDTIKLKIFDIAGNLVHDCQIANEPAAEQDILWDTSAIASGMYFAIVKSAGKTVRVPIAIEY